MMQTIRMYCEDAKTGLVAEAVRLLTRELKERGDVEVTETARDDAELLLSVESGIGAEGYRIEDSGGAVRIVGNDPHGLFYGVGRFLHTCTFSQAGVVLSAWRGTSIPACSFRGMYFAHNFRNWYRFGEMEDLERYVEDLALWGLNAIVFPRGTNPESPAEEINEIMLPKQHKLMQAAKRVGIQVGMLAVVNTIDHPPEPEIAAIPVPDTTPARRGNVGNKVCASHPEGFRAICEQLDKDLEKYRGVGLDFVATFPYDEGGCGCPECYPWGAKGYIKICKAFSQMARQKYPGCRFVLCTWCFDVCEEPHGEFDGLHAALQDDKSWCDIIMTDAHGDFPEWPLEHGTPGGLPMINFAEISMWGRFPWGGSGANPFPRRIVRIWQQAKHLMDGGLPYSEGRFEDLNKIACLRLFWDKEATVEEIVGDYVRYEFGTEALPLVAEAIGILEDNYPLAQLNADSAARALSLLQEAGQALPQRVRESWRWRILLLRAIIDNETAQHPDVVTAARNDAYEELTRIYCAQQAQCAVCPKAKSMYARPDVQEAAPVFAEHIGEHASDPEFIK